MTTWTPGRIESAQKAAEAYADKHTDPDGFTNKEGGLMLTLVSIIEEFKERPDPAKVWHEGFCVGERSGEREIPMNPHAHNPYK